MYEELFYKRLIELRMAKDVSARDMSLSIGQSSGYVNGLENRKGFPSMQVFFYICEYLGVSPSEFFDEGNAYPAEMKEALSLLGCLDHEQLISLIALLKAMTKEK